MRIFPVRRLAGIAVAVSLLLTPAPPARAPSLMDAYLAAHPGGTPLTDNDISYGDGAFVVTLTAPPGTAAAPDCPSGWFCFFDRPDFGFPRGKLRDCGRQELATWDWQFRVESAYYNLSSGSVTFLLDSQSLFRISAADRSRRDAYPYRNLATAVRRKC